VSASAHGTSAQSLIVSRTSGARVPFASGTYEFEGYYDNEVTCELEGGSWVGDLWGDGVVTGYYCLNNGQPAPEGPYELWLYVEPEQIGATPARVASGSSWSSSQSGLSQAA
jgi:hypothetical protein